MLRFRFRVFFYLDERAPDTAGVGLLEGCRQVTVDLVQRGVADADVDRHVAVLLRQILVFGRSAFWNYRIKTVLNVVHGEVQSVGGKRQGNAEQLSFTALVWLY